MSYVGETLSNLLHQTAFFNLSVGNYVMIAVACVFLFLAIKKGFEPLLLVPIAFGMLLVNIYPDIIVSPEHSSNGVGGLLYYFYTLDEWSILPSLIFLGVGAMTDFGPLIANPISFLLGAAAQFGIFGAYFLAILLGFNDKAAAAVSIIGGADGPTSIFLAGKLGQTGLMGPIAVAAYSYMALVPIIQPPIMKLFTTKKERAIKMQNLRPVSKLERILFPVVVTIVVCTLLPTTAPLVGMLMLGNLFRESGVVRQLQETASNALMYPAAAQRSLRPSSLCGWYGAAAAGSEWPPLRLRPPVPPRPPCPAASRTLPDLPAVSLQTLLSLPAVRALGGSISCKESTIRFFCTESCGIL